MSADYAAKEREFLASLEEDTGRSLEAWMVAIDAAGLAERNAIIDWLRREGFLFSKASWLERIHHNGGRPIYGADAMRAPAPRRPRRGSADTTLLVSGPAVVAGPSDPGPPPTQQEPPPPEPATDRVGLEELLAKAKAFRPLARFVLDEVAKSVPGVSFAVEASHIVIAARSPFALLAIGPRELRLGLALGSLPIASPFVAARFTNPPNRNSPAITHMIILTDARQVTSAVLAHVRDAAVASG